MNSAMRPSKRIFITYLTPGLLVYAFSAFLPIIMALRYSLYAWSGGPKMTFIGMRNYLSLLRDEQFWQAFGNNLYMLVLSLLGQVGLGLFFALLLNDRSTRFKKLHRTLCYFPSTLAPVVIAFIWMMVYNYNFGLLNAVFRALGMEGWTQSWLDNTGAIMPIVTIPLIWQNSGYFMVLMLAAFSAINTEVLEIAEIDGATGFKKAWYITLPLMKSTIAVCVMLCIAMNMRGFENVYIMTSGGPGYASTLVGLYAYKISFMRFNFGYGSAVSIGIILLCLLIIAISKLFFLERKDA